MKFNDYIFNEIQDIELNPTANESFMYDIYPELVDREAENLATDDYDESDVDIEVVEFIPYNSLIWLGLLKWYGDRETALKHIRSAVDTEDGVYYVTGVGYDTISSDLLDRPADGRGKEEFVKMLNEDKQEANYDKTHFNRWR